MTVIRVHPEIRAALESNRGVVALETAVLTHGLPRAPMSAPPCCATFLGGCRAWRSDQPANLELARAMTEVVRANGAVPATIGMLDGQLVIGLSDAELVQLGAAEGAVKLSSRDLAIAHAKREHGGTTVAGTLTAISLANASVHARPIRVFATGGIGGVHRGWTDRPDVSADLLALARAPVCVVSAGAKSILDLPATVEALDSLGVMVLGLGTRWFPRFLTEGAAPLAVQRSIETIVETASICLAHWNEFAATSGVLLANPLPSRFALSLGETEAIVAASVQRATELGIRAADLTPFLLQGLAERTQGRSIDANVAALLNNASVAARLATALCVGS